MTLSHDQGNDDIVRRVLAWKICAKRLVQPYVQPTALRACESTAKPALRVVGGDVEGHASARWLTLVVRRLAYAVRVALANTFSQNERSITMADKTIEIEAETLEEAREQVKSQIPEGLHLLSEQVISDGKPKTVRVVARNVSSIVRQLLPEFREQLLSLTRRRLVSHACQV
jgi:hypothetical protein